MHETKHRKQLIALEAPMRGRRRDLGLVRDSARVYATADLAIDATGAFEQVWKDAYRRYEYQPIVYYIDLSGDGGCTPGTDVGERHISAAWNPVGDVMLDEQLAVFALAPVTAEICTDVERCLR